MQQGRNVETSHALLGDETPPFTEGETPVANAKATLMLTEIFPLR